MSTLPRNPSTAVDSNLVVVTSTVPDLDELIRNFRATADSLAIASPDSRLLEDLCQQVVAITSELFPSGVRIVVTNDPEIPHDLYFVYRVRSDASADELAALNDRWHRRLLMLKGRQPGLFRLAIDP